MSKLWKQNILMIVYLAAFKAIENFYRESTKDVWLLSSFYEHKSGKFGDYVYQDKHILDSGAFSTFKNPEKAKTYDWDGYVKNYIQFIKETKQKLFFEIDIDCVVGLEKVEYYRKQIEDGTGLRPIPVWHSNRRWHYFEKMCDEYPYVAIGGLVGNRYVVTNAPVLKKFINYAHKRKVKIHALGYTFTTLLDELDFDSVDSTTWLSGGRYGQIHVFNGKNIVGNKPPKGKRAINYKITHIHNFNEWIKYQKYKL